MALTRVLPLHPENGEVTLNNSADYETKDTYIFDVIATDDGDLNMTQPVTVSVIDVNEYPIFISGSSGIITEESLISEIIYDAEATKYGPVGELVFSLSGADAHLLDIDAENGEVRLKASADYETQSVIHLLLMQPTTA